MQDEPCDSPNTVMQNYCNKYGAKAEVWRSNGWSEICGFEIYDGRCIGIWEDYDDYHSIVNDSMTSWREINRIEIPECNRNNLSFSDWVICTSYVNDFWEKVVCEKLREKNNTKNNNVWVFDDIVGTNKTRDDMIKRIINNGRGEW